MEVKNITAKWQVVHYDARGIRTESKSIILNISLEEPTVLGLQASVDIDLDTLNFKSKGQWITCYIEFPTEYDVKNIKLNRIVLNKVIPVEHNPKYGFVRNPEIKDRDKDGLPELMVKFDRAAVQAIVQPADKVNISVSGEVIKDGIPIPFQGIDSIRVISPGK